MRHSFSLFSFPSETRVQIKNFDSYFTTGGLPAGRSESPVRLVTATIERHRIPTCVSPKKKKKERKTRKKNAKSPSVHARLAVSRRYFVTRGCFRFAVGARRSSSFDVFRNAIRPGIPDRERQIRIISSSNEIRLFFPFFSPDDDAPYYIFLVSRSWNASSVSSGPKTWQFFEDASRARE